MPATHPHTPPLLVDQQVTIDLRGPGEWIATAPPGGRDLHVYRLAPADWLVSEVGRGSEGRGPGLTEALAALSTQSEQPVWWEAVAGSLDRER